MLTTRQVVQVAERYELLEYGGKTVYKKWEAT